MDHIRQRLESELDRTMDRIRYSTSNILLEEVAGAVGSNGFLADGGDIIRRNADREMSFATRSLLVERARKLGQALERLRDGDYGRCEECDELIAPARLRAMPEVTTCVRCQDMLERSQQFEPVLAGVDHTTRWTTRNW
jgi:RNA polymerase-binding transcription factor DksA